MKQQLTIQTFLLIATFSILGIIEIKAQQWTGSNTTGGNISRTGNVGIGLSNPAAKLHIFKTENALVEAFPGSPVANPYVPALRMETNFTAPNYLTKHIWDVIVGGSLQFRHATSDPGAALGLRMEIREDGLLTTGNRLYIGQSAEQGMRAGFGANPTGADGYYLAFGASNSGGNTWSFTNSAGGAIIQAGSNGNLHFMTKASGGSSLWNSTQTAENVKLIVTHDGKVGVGTTAPQKALTVANATEPAIRLENKGVGVPDHEIVSNAGSLYFKGGADGTGTALSDQMFIAKSGRVAIGTLLTPTTVGGEDISEFRLFVEGGILTKEVKVREDWSDYVFEDEYHLVSLKEAEAHIAQHGHLHNMPSEATIESNGLNLGDMAAMQQEKIEEIFLHLIEMNKQLNRLEEENKMLREKLEKQGGISNK